MTRESTRAKAARLLASGRVYVEHAEPGLFDARVVGDTETHRVRFERGGWRCSCLYRSACSHLLAAQLIAAPGIRLDALNKETRS